MTQGSGSGSSQALLVLSSTAYAEGISINELATALVDRRRRLTKDQS